ncbi:hypothetical protein [Microbacterium sp. NIBRBAC000506063]|uniref:hypothetical protein n=1 Tax=Microbacterium sp. NIBRBAC000506063 TaxID=2734618 RepID=UPI001BB4D1B0|nr:hypothetical protein [Microbacterium sp. NIBRBAC000506063]QTV79447.1 hypothetical protein KAE78_11125 [Microbacterium sp. NIBRBAC000506063]
MRAGTLDVVRNLRAAAVDDIADLAERGASDRMTISAELNRIWDALEHIAARVDAG